MLVAIPTLVVIGLTLISRNTKKNLVLQWGIASQASLGFIGIIIHELSHLIFAILFGHQITDFKLLIWPKRNSNNTTLGYVNHEWNTNSAYQNIGNVFIGTAPIYGCALAIYLIIKYMIPGLENNINNVQNAVLNLDIGKLSHSLYEFIPNIFSQNLFLSLLAIILIINIVIGGFDLSNADLKNSQAAFFSLLIISSIIIVTLGLIGLSGVTLMAVTKIVLKFISIMLVPIIFTFLVNLLVNILKFFH
ncbi:MAG: hypothetical protein HDS11_04240 [Bacteroides sp.]|nr:hypothetical protein [Bacteroides sp.]